MSFRVKMIKGINFLKDSFKNPKVTLKGIRKSLQESKKKGVIKKYGLKKGLPFIDILDLIPNFKETIDPYSYLSHSSYITDIALLMGLAKKFKDCRYLEIGTLRGESIVNVAKIAKECVSISLSDKELKKFGHNENYIKLQRFFSKKIKNIRHIKHNSHTYDYSKFKKGFDLIFVDGDHSYEGVKMDTQNVFKLLKNEDSIIVWHDGGTNFEDNRWSVLAAILDGCPPEKRKNLYRVSNTICTIYYPRKIKKFFAEYPSIPNKKFKIKIDIEKIKN